MIIWCVIFCREDNFIWLWGLFLSNAECYTRLKQIPKMRMWSCICCVVCWTVVVWVRLIYYVKIWDLCCDLLWHDNGIWFLSGVWCMVVWFWVIWADIVQSAIWVSCGNVFFCGCQSGSYAEHFFLIYVVGRVWFFDCVVYRACVRCCWYILVF